MMRGLVAYFVDRPLLVNMITAAVIGVGIVSATSLNRAFLPAAGSNRIDIKASLPGASAVDMERFVTFRLEEATRGLEGLDEVTSETTNGSSQIRLQFKGGHDRMGESLEQVRGRVDGIRHELPLDLLPVEITEQRISTIPVLDVLIENVDLSSSEHRLAVELVQERLGRLPQVMMVISSLPDLDLVITFDETAMKRLGVSAALAREKVLEYLRYAPLGEVTAVDQEIAVEIKKPFNGAEDLERLPLLMNRAGRGVRLGQVAKISLEVREKLTRSTLNGAPYVNMAVVTDVSSDAIDVAARVREELPKLKSELLPDPLSIRVGQDAADIIDHELSILKTNGLGGIFIVLVVLVLVLGWRVSVMTALGIPFCYLGTVVVLDYLGMNFNLISLVAMILVIGILVDDAIIVAEEFVTHLKTAETPREAAIGAVLKVGKPVLGMVATTVVAFAPMLFIKGDAAALLAPLPVVIISTLMLSAFESFLILPNHLQHLVKRNAKPVDRRFMTVLRNIYSRVLGWTLKLRYLAVVFVLGLVVLAVVVFQGMDNNFNGITIGKRIEIFMELEESASLDETQELVAKVEAVVRDLPESLVSYFQTDIGKARITGMLSGSDSLRGFKYAAIDIIPTGNMVEADAKVDEISELLDAKLEGLTGFKKLYVVKDKGNEERRDLISIFVSGGDRIGFQKVQDEIRNAIKPVTGVKDIFIDESRMQPALRFIPVHASLLRFGFTETSLFLQLREHFSRQELIRVRLDGREIELHTEFADDPGSTPEALKKISVLAPHGAVVPLGHLGSWERAEVLRRIEHKDLLRVFKVDALYETEDIDAEEVKKGVEESLQPVRAAFPGYHISVKEREQETKTKKHLINLLITCLVLVYVCLALSLNSLIQPVVVIFAIPFGFVGVILALASHGMVVDTMATIGIIGLVGVVVNDSLVMTATINGRVAEAVGTVRDAIQAGATSRFQAVLLTSVTTLGGVLPLAYGFGGEAGWIQPMVFALGWGLLFATFLTLLFIPCVLLILHDLQRVFAFARSKFRRG